MSRMPPELLRTHVPRLPDAFRHLYLQSQSLVHQVLQVLTQLAPQPKRPVQCVLTDIGITIQVTWGNG
eukprot:2200035-Amphidinium_carterae.1